MNKYNFPLEIGNQYENWEFQLEIKEDKIKNYDSYRYLELVRFEGVQDFDTELIFHWDNLIAVILATEYSKQIFSQMKSKLSNKLKACKPLNINSIIINRFSLNDGLELWLYHNPSKKETQIIYGKTKILEKILNAEIV